MGSVERHRRPTLGDARRWQRPSLFTRSSSLLPPLFFYHPQVVFFFYPPFPSLFSFGGKSLRARQDATLPPLKKQKIKTYTQENDFVPLTTHQRNTILFKTTTTALVSSPRFFFTFEREKWFFEEEEREREREKKEGGGG
jgi:hypothetical protein